MNGMLINNTEVRIAINFSRGIIHVLDLNKEGRMSLTNAINYSWQCELIAKLNNNHNLLNYKWLLYHTDGEVSEYKEGYFKLIDANNSDEIHPSFVPSIYTKKETMLFN